MAVHTSLSQNLLTLLKRYRWPLLMALVWTAVFGAYAILRHNRLNSSVYDFGIKSQVIWNTYQGRWFASTIEVKHYLGDHVQLIFVLLAPLFALWGDPRLLLIIQSLLLGLAAIPLYRIAKRHLASEWLALTITAVYLLYPSVGFINRFGFHALTFVVFFFFLAIDLIECKRFKLASFVLLLALLTREDVGFTIFAFGLYLAFVRRHKTYGLTWAAIGIGWSVFAIFGIIPTFRGGESDTLARYAWLGESPSEMLQTVWQRPLYVLEYLLGDPIRQLFLLKLLLPLGFLALLSPLTLAIALPALGYNLLSDVPSQTSIYFQYISPVIPFLFLAAIEGISHLRSWLKPRWSLRRQRPFLIGWLAAAITIAWLWDNPLTTPINDPYFPVYGIEPVIERTPFDEAASLLPADAPVATMMAYGTHLSLRPEYMLFYDRLQLEKRPYGFPQTKYLLLNLTDLRWGVNARIFYAAIETAIGQFGYEALYYGSDVVLLTQTNTQTPATGAVLQRVTDLQEAGGKYAPTASQTLSWLGQQWVTETLPETAVSAPATFAPAVQLLGYTVNETAPEPGRPFCPTLYWQTAAPIDANYTVFMHLSASDGFVSAQRDSEPAFGFYPTPQWQPGQIIGDMHCLQIPITLAPGAYSVLVGLYDATTGERLPLLSESTTDNAFALSKLIIPAGPAN